MIDRNLGKINPYLQGTPLEGLSTSVKDLAKGVQLTSNEARDVGKDLVKLSQPGLAERVKNEVQQFV